jgi:hypothetical protein
MVCFGSIATGPGKLQLQPCPQYPGSDGWPSKCRPSRWANKRLPHCSKAALLDRLIGELHLASDREASASGFRGLTLFSWSSALRAALPIKHKRINSLLSN